jgi:hypothetical protein
MALAKARVQAWQQGYDGFSLDKSKTRQLRAYTYCVQYGSNLILSAAPFGKLM